MDIRIVTPRGERLACTETERIVLRRREPSGLGSEVVVLSNHGDLLMRTAESVVRFGAPGDERRFEVAEGVAELCEGHLVIFAGDAREVTANMSL